MEPRPLTDRQRSVLEFIREQIRDRGTPPTIREIGEAFGMRSTGSVRDILEALEKKGYLERRGSISRGLVPDSEPREQGVPILGRVAAGVPLLAEENLEGYLNLEGKIRSGREDCFALRVRGDSMIGAGIVEDDFVVVRSCRTAPAGRIVVALLDGEATVKRLREHRGRWVLQPENPRYQPIPVNEETRILGQVIALVRDYE